MTWEQFMLWLACLGAGGAVALVVWIVLDCIEDVRWNRLHPPIPDCGIPTCPDHGTNAAASSPASTPTPTDDASGRGMTGDPT